MQNVCVTPSSTTLILINRDLTVKRGINDIEVEIFINNSWVQSYMSNVIVGDFWQILVNSLPDVNHCYLCVTKPQLSSIGLLNRNNNNPTIVMGVNKVVVKPIVEFIITLETPLKTITTLEHIEYSDYKDIAD